MAFTAENGNFEGRSRATGAFGNETGQTGRRGRSGAAEAANRTAMARAATASAPSGPFKSPVYDATLENLARLAETLGPMIANPGFGLATPLARSILSGDPYSAFGIPRDWSSYSPRDVNPMGSNPRGNTGSRDAASRQATLRPAPPLQKTALPRPSIAMPGQPRPYVPRMLGEEIPGLPLYGTGMRRPGKAGGYGGLPRAAATGSIGEYL